MKKKIIWLIFFVITNARGNLSEISGLIQPEVLGSYALNLPVIHFGKFFEGSSIAREVMFDVYTSKGEERRCLSFKEDFISLYKTSKHSHCLGEVVFEFSLKEKWSWGIFLGAYKSHNLYILKLKSRKKTFDILLPNLPVEEKVYKRNDNLEEFSPLGFYFLTH